MKRRSTFALAATTAVALGVTAVAIASFDPATNYDVGMNPEQSTGADFDRQSGTDIAVPNGNDDTVSVLPN